MMRTRRIAGVIAGAAMAGLALWPTMGPAAASRHDPTADIEAFDRFLASTSPICEHQSAILCVDSAWRFADRDRNRNLSLGELTQIRDGLRAWMTWKKNEIPLAQRRMVQFGLMLVDGIGLPNLVESYDANGDGAVSRTELLSDVRLDERPLGQILLDANAVDWEALKRRLGPIAGALSGLAVKNPDQ